MAEPILALEHVSAGYARRPLWSAFDLTIQPGQFIAIVGPTGGGKSTLLKTMLGLMPCMTGKVHRASGRRIGYVPQRETIDWHFPVTVEQVVRMGRYGDTSRWPWSTAADRLATAALLERLGLTPYARRAICELSGGQQQRVFLARALVGQPHLVLLDEPTAGVDLKTQHDILHVLRELNGAGVTIVLTTHDLNTVASHIPWVICFNRGLVAQGTPAVVLTPSTLRKTYDADMAVIRQDGMTFIVNRSLVHRHAGMLERTGSDIRKTADGTAS